MRLGRAGGKPTDKGDICWREIIQGLGVTGNARQCNIDKGDLHVETEDETNLNKNEFAEWGCVMGVRS